VGIRVAITPVPTASQFKTELARGAYQGFMFNESPDFSDPGYSYRIWNDCKGLQNFTGWCDASLDTIAAKIQSVETPASERTALIGQLSDAMNANMPEVFLTETPTVFARAKCITRLPTTYVGLNNEVYQATSSC
jgi:ABC-type transport system substrate-binding protein